MAIFLKYGCFWGIGLTKVASTHLVQKCAAFHWRTCQLNTYFFKKNGVSICTFLNQVINTIFRKVYTLLRKQLSFKKWGGGNISIHSGSSWKIYIRWYIIKAIALLVQKSCAWELWLLNKVLLRWPGVTQWPLGLFKSTHVYSEEKELR